MSAPSDIIHAGEHNTNATVMLGGNRDEQSLWWSSPPYSSISTEDDVREVIMKDRWNGGTVDAAIEAMSTIWSAPSYIYPSDMGNQGEWWWKGMRFFTDAVPGLGPCGVRWLARALRKGGSKGVFVYYFRHPTQADFRPLIA